MDDENDPVWGDHPVLSDLEETPSSETLCDTCAAIDFHAAFGLEIRSWYGAFVAPLGAILETSLCHLCRFFAQMLPDYECQDNPALMRGKFHLRALSANRCFGIETYQPLANAITSVVLAIFPGHQLQADRENMIRTWIDKLQEKGFICYTPPYEAWIYQGFFGRRIATDSIDYAVIKNWLGTCFYSHRGEGCNEMALSIPGFRVVDCKSRKIVSAPPDCEYVALSYVWGVQREPSVSLVTDASLPSQIPRVIEDSILLAAAIGFNYLWVDRYCIDQSNPKEKHTQISNMDSIYMGATLTIIAAAGEDAAVGLPGVGPTHRVEQPYVNLGGDLSIVSSLMNPRLSVEASVWNTRGWTYQEGLLSRRRLIFTSQQAYFQCGQMHCFESLNITQDVINSGEALLKGRKKDRVFHPLNFAQRINEYSTRQLSFPTDILDAIIGVLKQFEKASPATFQFWGLPIRRIADIPANKSTDYWKTSPFRCKQLAQSLFWVSDLPSQRREGFPSWSWVGWNTFTGFKLAMPGSESLGSRPFDDDGYIYDLKVRVQTKHGECVLWTFDNDGIPPQYRSSEALTKFIFIWGWTMKLKLRLPQERSACDNPDLVLFEDIDSELVLYDKPSFNIVIPRDAKEKACFDGVLLGWRTDEGPFPPRYFTHLKILVLKREGEYFSRVGVVAIHFKGHFNNRGSDLYLGKINLERREFKVG